MTTATLTKVGNSMAVVLPKGLRQQAGFEAGEKLSIDSPRKGVVVITAIHDNAEDRLARLEKVEARISKRSRLAPWPKGKTADDFIREARDARADEIVSL